MARWAKIDQISCAIDVARWSAKKRKQRVKLSWWIDTWNVRLSWICCRDASWEFSKGFLRCFKSFSLSLSFAAFSLLLLERWSLDCDIFSILNWIPSQSELIRRSSAKIPPQATHISRAAMPMMCEKNVFIIQSEHRWEREVGGRKTVCDGKEARKGKKEKESHWDD